MTSRQMNIVARDPLPSSPFAKHIDKTTGRFYHVMKATGDSTWDVPHGQKLPLETPSSEVKNIINGGQYSKTGSICKLGSIDRQRQERLRIIQSIRDKHERDRRKESSFAEAKKDRILDTIWKSACDCGNDDGIVRVNWKELGYVSERIYNFENDYGAPLQSLSMLGNKLRSLHSLPEKCLHLQRLHLGSNQIQELDSSIGSMTKLTHLHLVRNKLHTLPSSIGNLVHLQVLDLANNCLKILPITIGKLGKIKKLNLDCNMLKSLPEEIIEMNCEELSMNDNKLISLPILIGRMPFLKVLLVNDNCLKSIPANICGSSTLRVLHLSRNYITELPKSIGSIVSLECLWLDFNKLSSLPSGFHHLKNLKEDNFKLEGNHMTSPPVDTIAKGATEILKWCESKLLSCDFAKNRNIVLCVQKLLEQVGKYKLCGINDNEQPHESVYEAGVDYKGDKFYQFLFPTFWSNFIPSMEAIWANTDGSNLKEGAMYSLPYERQDIEQALNKFHDAGGKVMHYVQHARFRRCSCVDSKTCKRKVCIPSKKGWMCKRPAVLVRMNMILESEMVEKRRRFNDTQRVERATNSAIKVAKRYLATREGEVMIRSMAEDQLESGLVSSNQDLLKYPQTSEEWRALERKEDSERDKSGISIVKRCLKSIGSKRMNKLKETEATLREEFITNDMEAERFQATKVNDLMKKTIEKWRGNNTRVIYFGWKRVANEMKLQMQKDEEKKREINQLRHDGDALIHEIVTQKANQELKHWKKHWNDFDDILYWINSQTGETRFVEPRLKDILPSIKFYSERIIHNSVNKAQTEGDVQRSQNASGSEKEAILAASRVLERRRKLA